MSVPAFPGSADIKAAGGDTGPPNVFSVDLEDWYQGLEVDIDQWNRFTPRLEQGMRVLLELLDATDTRATFFVLGHEAQRTPGLIREMARRGHEIATHGWSHRFVYRQRPEEFRAELRRSIQLLGDLAGKPIHGYRAPFFSITSESLWALDILVEEGIRYDSSIFPTLNYRYGLPGAGRDPGWLATPSGARLFEIPLSTVKAPGRTFNIPLGGGGYFRLYPYGVTRWLIRRLREREGLPLIFYVHPWEYDPGQPRVRLPRLVPEITHYMFLSSTARRTARLLRDFRFTTMERAFADAIGVG